MTSEQEKIDRVRAEIDHAINNGHMITQGQGIIEKVPGVRLDYLEAALGPIELTAAELSFIEKAEELRAQLLRDLGEDAQPAWLNPANIKIVTQDNVTLDNQETALALRAVAALAHMQSEWHGAPDEMYRETLALEALAKKLEEAL